MLGWPESCRCEAVSAITKFVFSIRQTLRIRPNSIRKKTVVVNDGWLGSEGGGRGINPVVRFVKCCRISAHTWKDSSYVGLVSRT